MLERSIDRAADLAFEVVNTTATHARRVAGIVSTALGLTARELSDLVWDYLDLASQLRWPDRAEPVQASTPPANHVDAHKKTPHRPPVYLVSARG